MQGTSSHPLANSTTTSCSTAQGKTAISATPHLFSSPWTEALYDSPSFSSFLGLETSVPLWHKLAQCYWCQPAPAVESAFTWQLLSSCKRNCSHRLLIFRLNMRKGGKLCGENERKAMRHPNFLKGFLNSHLVFLTQNINADDHLCHWDVWQLPCYFNKPWEKCGGWICMQLLQSFFSPLQLANSNKEAQWEVVETHAAENSPRSGTR